MTDQIPMGMLAGDYERCAHMLDDALKENERLRAALHEAQNLMCDVAQETRDVGLVEGETNARLQAYCKAMKNDQGSTSNDT